MTSNIRFPTITLFLLLFLTLVAAQSGPSVICIAGQCLQGFPNTTLGATLSASGASTSIQLLPGQYSSSTNPQLLHDILTSSSASLSPSPGFENSSATLKNLPMNLALEPGIAIFSGVLYSGQSGFSALPSSPGSSSGTSLSAKSLVLASNVKATLSASDNNTFTLWHSVPSIDELPLSSGLTLQSLQSSSCSPSCSSTGGICSSSGSCQCRSNFTGTSCEQCAKGFYGPSCTQCPTNCDQCDEGISGTGKCLMPATATPLKTCNCLNGLCDSTGSCQCLPGWTKADNGTECAQCSAGFFLSSTGECKVCQIGCTTCSGPSGQCTACKQGFSLDANDATKCNPPESTTSTGQVCPDGSFSSGDQCTTCDSNCSTCTAGTSNDCIVCKQGMYKNSSGQCVSADSDGVCDGSSGTLVADNVKRECEACGSGCTTCKIPSFTTASTIQQLQCTGCLPGSFLADGKCIGSCPSGSFVSPQDNVTCTACSSSCSSCAGSADFCTACPSGQLATPDGKCTTTCPTGTFASPETSPTKCEACHPDCSSCSGSAFNQCTSCPSSNPVLSSGRCLASCESKGQFFDPSSKSCTSCDGSCATCSSSGPNSCLSCNGDQVLRKGACVSANCQQSSSVISELGVCLSELSNTPSSTSSSAPLPSVTGLDTPTTGKKRLEWWQILLMALGCAFIFLVFIMIWRRRARKKRAERTQQFARQKFGSSVSDWKWKLVRFGEKLFGHNKSTRVMPEHIDMPDVEKGRTDRALVHQPSRSKVNERHIRDDLSERTAPSLYSEVPGPRRSPYVRQPVPDSRFSSASTLDPYYTQPAPEPVTRVKPANSKNPFWR